MESRYLLILVESLSVLSLILDEFTKAQEQQPEIIFGSRFSDDVSYTQVYIYIYIHASIQISLCAETLNSIIWGVRFGGWHANSTWFRVSALTHVLLGQNPPTTFYCKIWRFNLPWFSK